MTSRARGTLSPIFRCYCRIDSITRAYVCIVARLEFIARSPSNGESLMKSASGTTLQILVCILREVARVAGPRKSLIRLYVRQSAQQKSGSTSHDRVRCCPKLWRDCEEDRRNGGIERNRADRMLPRGWEGREGG